MFNNDVLSAIQDLQVWATNMVLIQQKQYDELARKIDALSDKIVK